MKALPILILAILLSSAFAADCTLTPYNVNDKVFYLINPTSGCQISTLKGAGLTITGAWINTSNAGWGENTGNVAVAITANYINLTATASASGYSGSNPTLTTGVTATYTDANGTTATISAIATCSPTGPSTPCSSSGSNGTATSGNGNTSMGASVPFSTTAGYAHVTISTTGAYLSAKGTSSLYTTDMTGGGVPDMADFCLTQLYYTTPIYKAIVPNITYFAMTGEAYPQLHNGSWAYIKNNTETYVYDQGDNRWYTVPPTTCTPGTTLTQGVAVVFYASNTASGAQTPWTYANGSTASLASGSIWCNGSTVNGSSTTPSYIRVRVASSTVCRSFNITAVNATGYALWNTTTTCTQDTIVTVPANSTTSRYGGMIGITVTDGAALNASIGVTQSCTGQPTLPSRTNKSVLVVLAIILIVIAVAMETWVGFGFHTFALGSVILGAFISAGFMPVAAIFLIMLVFETAREMK